MKKHLLMIIAGVLVIAGCAGNSNKNVSYANYKQDKHDLELVSDKNINTFSSCIRSALAPYNAKEEKIANNDIRFTKAGDFTVEVYRAIDSTYARADSQDPRIIALVERCK